MRVFENRFLNLVNEKATAIDDEAIIHKYLKHIKPNISEHWRYETKRKISLFKEKHTSIMSVTKKQAQEYIDEIASRRKAGTVTRIYHILNKFYNWLVAYYDLPESPFKDIKPPKERKNNIDIVYATKEERQTILEIADNHKQGLALWLAHYCGLRRGEIFSIKKKHVNLDSETITVVGKGDRIRTVPMPEIITKKMKKHLKGIRDDDIILPFDKLSSRYLIKFINRVIDQLDLTKKEKKSLKEISGFQTGRHSFCTHMIQAGVPIEIVAHIAGHTPEVARRHYMRFIPKDKKDKRIELIN